MGTTRHQVRGDAAVAGTARARTTQAQPDGFFTLGRRDNHWWLVTPDGKPFFSLGLNHIDPASLRYPENIHIWRDKYGGSTEHWIRESVAPNLKQWAFNTVGWVQEVTVLRWRHSRSFRDLYTMVDTTHIRFTGRGSPFGWPCDRPGRERSSPCSSPSPA
ncbi:MAG: hypothetical protein OXH72_16895, partial [Caldilineaceae bacterium]|nr:hypothetical protein [Caldilineaceae bacterium]